MRFLSYFSIRLPLYLTYMVQQVEYEPDKFLDWIKRRPDLSQVMHRQELVKTKKASALVDFQYLIILLSLITIGIICSKISLIFLILILIIPIISIISLISAIYIGKIISIPFNHRQIKKSQKIFGSHPGLKIVILGSYGKTTMKELLMTVLGEDKKVRATPGNKNVPISHARWAASLDGDEDVLLIELGESKPGDVAAFCKNISPDMAVITGIAPNHLDKYKTLKAVADDLLSVSSFINTKKIYINMDNYVTENHKSVSLKANVFSETGTAKVKISEPEISINGMRFSVKISNKTAKLTTKLIGKHLLGPLAVCIEIANELGIDIKHIQKGVERTNPFEHRMQPKELSGYHIIDDTYNGSLEGFRAGLELLKSLKAKRKIYVTPGLVDQGQETENVHQEIGKLIAECNPDKVVLMQNSVANYIKQSLEKNSYKGDVEIREDPLEFYTNLDHILAAGDLVLLQNDWTDNYY